MRRQSVPAALRLTIILLFAANLEYVLSQHEHANHTAEEEHLVCKKSDSQQCVTWRLCSGADPDIIIKESPSNATQFCGLSDLKRILPHRKFITVKSLAKDGVSKIVFCKGLTRLRGNIINWKQVEKALNTLSRTRRQTTFYPKGRYRGQTQSQYLAIDRGNSKDEGKAEAHSAADSSRASVSGNSGMGQAQSQSIFDPNCDDCYGKSDHEQPVASLKRGPFMSEGGGTKYAPENGYGLPGSYGPGKDGSSLVGGSNGLRPGQGINNGPYRPSNGQGPSVNGALKPTNTFAGSPGGYGYGPNGQQGGSGGFGPSHVNHPGPTGYGPASGTTPGGSQGGNGGYGPGDQQKGSGGYGPEQGTIPGTFGFRPSLASSPGSSPAGSGGYGPSLERGPGSVGFNSFPGSTPAGSLGGSFGPEGRQDGSGNYGPGGQLGQNGGYGPIGQQGRNGGYRPGEQHGGGRTYGPSLQEGGRAGYIPSNHQGGNGGYGPGGQPGGSGGYSPEQRGGPGSTGVGPSLDTSLGKSPGGNSEYRPGQGPGPGSLAYAPTSGQEYGPRIGSGPGQYGENGLNYINRNGGNIFSPNQGISPNVIRGNTPGQNGPTSSGYGPQQTLTPGQNNVNPGGNIGYPANQGPLNNGGFGPVQSTSSGGNGQVPPGSNSGGAISYPTSNVPDQSNPLYGPGQSGTTAIANKGTGTNWPLALGPYPGPPGSSVYCCVVPNNYGQNIGTDGNVISSTGTGYPYYGTGQGGPGITGGSAPSNLFDRTYGAINPGVSDMRHPLTYDKGSISGPVNPYGSGNINDPSSSYGTRPGGSGSIGSGIPAGIGGQNGNFGTSFPGGSVNQNGVVGPARQNGLQGPNNFGIGSTGGTAGQNGMFGPGNNGHVGQNGVQGPGNFGTGGPSGQNTYHPITSGGLGAQNGMQAPAPFETGTTGSGTQSTPDRSGVYRPSIYGDSGLQQPGVSRGPGNNIFVPGGVGGQPGYQNAIQTPGVFGTNPTGIPPSQNGKQGPGVYSTGTPGGLIHSGVQGPGLYNTGLPGGVDQHGLQGPGNTNVVSPGGQGQNGLQGPGLYNTGSPGGQGQNGLQGPGLYNTGSPGGQGQNGLPGAGLYNTGSPGGLGQHGLQGPGINNGVSPGGQGQNGLQGPGLYNNGSPGGQGQNGLPGAGLYNTGLPGGLGQHGLQGPTINNAVSPGGQGQNGLQGPGLYNTGSLGGQGQNGLPGAGPGLGTYGIPTGPGGHIGMQGPGRVDTGTSRGPAGPQGPATYGTDTSGSVPSYGIGNNQNIPNNQLGSNPNTGNIGGPGQNGNIIPGGVTSDSYPGGTQYTPNSRVPGEQTYTGGNTGLYGNEPQGSLNINLPSVQNGINSQGNTLQGTEYNGIPQNFVDTNSIAMDGDDSEAEASVNQAANGTTASASSKGGNNKGRAQTHVHGTYTGGGSFQAQAQITGENKEAESEVSGGKKGASSSATGSGRNNKSQASVQLGSETGSIQTQSQSNGAMHSSNSQVQGSIKGGMADAQAKGPGSTSSQAQIGFTPYKDGDKAHDVLQTPFTGGGVASAQSSGRIGQSQSQLHGTFKYGITYNGAAQSGASLDKDAVFPNRLNFDKIDVFDEGQKNINLTENSQPEILSTESSLLSKVPLETKTEQNSNYQEITTEKANDETMTNSESRYSSHTHLDHHKTNSLSVPSPTAVSSRRSFQSGYEKVGTDYEYTTDKDEIQPEEYDTDPGYVAEGNDATDAEQNVGEEFPNYEEYIRDYETHQSIQNPRRKGLDIHQTTGGNTQHIVLGPLNKHDAEVIQKNSEKPDESKVYQPGERVPGIGGYRIPMGFTGSVKSVASKENTYVVGSKHSPSQAQTVTLTPGTGKINYMYPPNHGKYVSPKDLRSLQSQNPNDDRYVSVSKSVTRALDGENNIRKQYSHTYYTKSSSCGYFTFTCTMVSGVDGRKKVCKPKIPTNPDGTPIRC